MVQRNLEKRTQETLEDLILTAWCVYEDITQSDCKLILNQKWLHISVNYSTITRDRVIASLVNVFCKIGTGLHGQMMVTIEEQSTDNLKLLVSSHLHQYSFREKLTSDFIAS